MDPLDQPLRLRYPEPQAILSPVIKHERTSPPPFATIPLSRDPAPLSSHGRPAFGADEQIRREDDGAERAVFPDVPRAAPASPRGSRRSQRISGPDSDPRVAVKRSSRRGRGGPTPLPFVGFQHGFTPDELRARKPLGHVTTVSAEPQREHRVTEVTIKRHREEDDLASQDIDQLRSSSSVSSSSPTPEESDPARAKLEQKRRQNAAAARRSRQRKMELIDTLSTELEEQRRRAERAEEDLARMRVENAILRGELNRERDSNI